LGLKKSKPKKKTLTEAPNLVKTQNRLIGVIANTDIYNDDD